MSDAKQHATACSRCGGETEAGHLVWNGPIRFKAEEASGFSRGTRVRARACYACGNIDLTLER
ncbi:MAG: hypothetical protein KIT16_02060 [Rhodospirillaceae bacterium]|nr:hypothetical protein [Rhodospirillaceae bacterium]